jgi:cyanophycin synthetase
MIIREVKVLRGPNFWSIKHKKLVQLLVDLQELEYLPTNKIPGFYDRLHHLLPSLYDHECSEGIKGGFFTRVKEGTWMGHVIEHIALEIQSLAGIPAGFGRTRGTGKEGCYYVVFAYAEEKSGIYAGEAAFQIATALIKGEEYDLSKTIKTIHELWTNEKLGPSTDSIVQEAQRRNIPYIRLDDNSLVQLGYGARQKRIEATITCNTSQIAVDLACNKDATKKLLTAAHIPVADGVVIDDVKKLNDAISTIEFPIVIKPLNGNHGKGATVNITNYLCAVRAFERAQKFSREVMIEKFIVGNDYRILIINNKFQAASLRKPAAILGNGRNTIEELIEKVNKDPRRGMDHEKVLTKIHIDESLIEWIGKSNCNLETILPLGRELILKPTANLSTGGTATDVTEEVCSSNIFLFERIARTIGLDICGIDIMAPDLRTPLKDTGGVVLEINAAPGFRMHLEPTAGKKREVSKAVIDMLFKDDGRIPIIAVTGTNGKTTTTRLISHIVQHAGFRTGYTTTEGIYINGEIIEEGDCSGPKSAESILRDPGVEFAVLETARGGILRNGLGFDQCNVAVITNIAEDHLGLDGINDLEKLARVKSVVAESVCPSGYVILNADDDLVYQMKDNVICKVALFSLHSDNIRIEEHCTRGGIAAYLENGYLLIRKGNYIIPVEEVKNIPITFNGSAEFNIYNSLGSVLAAYTYGIKINTIREALSEFQPSFETTPGRANIFQFENFTVLLDYAHNPHGLKAVGKLITSMHGYPKTGIIAGVGDRRDQDIIAIGEEAAKIFDKIIIRHDKDLRGRTVKEVEELVLTGIKKVNGELPVMRSLPESESVHYVLKNAEAGSLIVILSDDIKAVAKCIQEYKSAEYNKVGLQYAV